MNLLVHNTEKQLLKPAFGGDPKATSSACAPAPVQTSPISSPDFSTAVSVIWVVPVGAPSAWPAVDGVRWGGSLLLEFVIISDLCRARLLEPHFHDRFPLTSLPFLPMLEPKGGGSHQHGASADCLWLQVCFMCQTDMVEAGIQCLPSFSEDCVLLYSTRMTVTPIFVSASSVLPQ